MNSVERRYIFRKALLLVWGMITLVLFSCVALLVYEMLQKGQNPLVIKPKRQQTLSTEVTPKETTLPTREVMLYFAGADGRLLSPEQRRIEFSDYTAENCRKALEGLINGPRDILVNTISQETRVRSVYMLEGGQLVVDLSGAAIADLAKSVSSEGLMIYGIVNTLSQDALTGRKQDAVNTVRFLIEGSLPEEYLPSEPRHIDMSQPFSPDPDWIATEERDVENV